MAQTLPSRHHRPAPSAGTRGDRLLAAERAVRIRRTRYRCTRTRGKGETVKQNVGLPIYGVKESLRVIGQLDTQLRKQFTRDFKDAVRPMVEAAQNNVPSRAPLSGMERKWKGQPVWKGSGYEERQIKLQINTRRARNRNRALGAQYETVGTIRVIAKGRGLAIFDMAGRKGSPSSDAGDRLIDRMNGRFRSASRAMWPAADETKDEIVRNCIPIVKQVEQDANRLLRATGGVTRGGASWR